MAKMTEDLIKDKQKQEEEALAKCKQMAAKLDLKMKPLAARFNPEANCFIIFFRAEERIDFRELVRKLRHGLRARLELRQVGPRDEAKLLGGTGKCGYPLCCQSFLGDFAPVSIKMAKEQGLALNPMKISGICGRLLCCLAYESKDYTQPKKMSRSEQETTAPQEQVPADSAASNESIETYPLVSDD